MKKKLVTFGVIAFAIATLAFVLITLSTDKHKSSVMATSEVAPVLSMTVLAADPYKLSCGDMPESDYLRQAPYGAKRISEHVLEVYYSSGVRKFIDKPPHEELNDGLHWSYCGYNENVRAHLIARQDNAWYSGSLLFEKSGKVVKAGSTVVFSPNKLNFLAIQQWAGADGQDWTLFDTSGHKLWNGFSTIDVPRKPTDTYTWEAVTIENPSLSDDLQITVEMNCWQSKKGSRNTLKKVGGKWKWLRKIEC